jgi:outer membrane protein TolC
MGLIEEKELPGKEGDLEQLPLPPRRISQVNPEVAVGIPADLPRRRPDGRRAERQAVAQSARIGAAKADLYPHTSIVGTIGVAAEQFWDLCKTPDSMFGNIVPAFQLAFARGQIVLSLIDRYRSLGGGWEMRLRRDQNPDCLPSGFLPLTTQVL